MQQDKLNKLRGKRLKEQKAAGTATVPRRRTTELVYNRPVDPLFQYYGEEGKRYGQTRYPTFPTREEALQASS